MERSINSILTQTNNNWLLYIVNDGSKPYLESFLRKNYLYCPKIHYLEHATTLGLPTALNTGHKAGKSEFISWTSDDNFYAANFVEEMLQIIPQYDFIRSYEYHFKEGHLQMIRWDPRKGNSGLSQSKILYDGYLGGSHLYRRTLYESTTGYDSNLAGIEDLDMYYQFMQKSPRVGFIEKSLYYYQTNSSCFSLDGVIKAREKFLEKWKKN